MFYHALQILVVKKVWGGGGGLSEYIKICDENVAVAI